MFSLISVSDHWRPISFLDNRLDFIDSLIAWQLDGFQSSTLHEVNFIMYVVFLVFVEVPDSCVCLALRTVHSGVVADDVDVLTIDFEEVIPIFWDVKVVMGQHGHAAHSDMYN